MIGERLSPVLVEIEDALWEHEALNPVPPGFTDQGLRAAVKICMAALLERMWKLQKAEDVPREVREDMARNMGEEFRRLIKVHTDIDTHDLYK